jgi:2-haloacid dehalogenase
VQTLIAGIRACVFDAYGTLFDVAAAAAHCREELGELWQPLAELWRTKQLQYSWLRSLMAKHEDFWHITSNALDFAMASLKIKDKSLRTRLLELYLHLDVYPEVPRVLHRLRDSGRRTAILSNGSPWMLQAAVEHAGIASLLDAVMSVEEVGVFKPHPSVYRLAEKHLGLPPNAMSFQSSNAWDAHAAKNYGFRVIWVNRFGQARECLPGEPDAEIRDLSAVPELLAAVS